MDIINQVRIASIPAYQKVFLFFALLGVFSFNIYIIIMGVLFDSRPHWAEAGAGLIGSLLPIFLVAYILWISNSGIPALKLQTTKLLTETLPKEIKNISDYKKITAAHIEEPTLEVMHRNSRSDAEYRLKIKANNFNNSKSAQLIDLPFRIELNVRRANISIFLQKNQLSIEAINEMFAHSINGAAQTSKDKLYALKLNEHIELECIDGVDYYRLVFTTFLHDDFLYLTQEQLYFCQDLMYFLKSILRKLHSPHSDQKN